MSKQERLRKVKTMNPQWLVLRLLFALPTGVLVFYFLQTEADPWLMGGMLLALTITANVLFSRESSFVKSLTPNEQAKKVVGIQYKLDYLFVIMMAVIFPLMMRFSMLTLSPFILFMGSAILILFTQFKLDQQIEWIDAEQPTRREIQRTRFSWRA
ncbi:hypothetical protein EVJ24_12425 [Exiguobacterium sp. SH1S21]|uniref:hypothetical protein n=1 Tax=Exiguobacterium sp. SH1S21 TaxID=2510953 RepID=UPI00103DC0E3|nr:hypothetical protein [Exiguobacterium sp. SH1S21]TCI51931.1 hypothetical protein EVJ24_12425 [Exiguobacterium sp. SH1S21]